MCALAVIVVGARHLRGRWLVVFMIQLDRVVGHITACVCVRVRRCVRNVCDKRAGRWCMRASLWSLVWDAFVERWSGGWCGTPSWKAGLVVGVYNITRSRSKKKKKK
jgi:hypothetical protein